MFLITPDEVLYFQVILVTSFLAYLSYLDLKYREVPDRLLYVFVFTCVIFSSINMYINLIINCKPFILELTLFTLSIMIGPLFSYILYKLDFLGPADVYIIAGLSLAFYNDLIYDMALLKSLQQTHVPPIIPILFYSNIIMALYIPYNMLRNIVKYNRILPPKNIGIKKWIVIIATGKPVKIKDYLHTKHTYVLQLYRFTTKGIDVKFRATFSIEEDPETQKTLIKSLIKQGYLKESDYIWITHGVPFITLILTGFVLVLVVGDTVLQMIASILLQIT